MTYSPIIPTLLDKVTCLTSALFLFLSAFLFFPLFVFFFFFLIRFLDQVGGGRWGWAGLSAVHTYFFSLKNDTHRVPAVESNQPQAFQ